MLNLINMPIKRTHMNRPFYGATGPSHPAASATVAMSGSHVSFVYPPQPQPTKLVSVRVDKDLWREIKKRAVDEDLSVAAVVDSALRDYLAP